MKSIAWVPVSHGILLGCARRRSTFIVNFSKGHSWKNAISTHEWRKATFLSARVSMAPQIHARWAFFAPKRVLQQRIKKVGKLVPASKYRCHEFIQKSIEKYFVVS